MIERALCLHVELLHDERVWRRMQLALAELDKRNLKITFLVYPLRSIAAGHDIADRVRQIADQGHEVGQHTHFYVGEVTERPNKQSDLSDQNVRACIARDYAWLRQCGIEPKGFCGGNFMMTETAFATLAEFGFSYDCSARLPWERKNFEMPHPWLDGARVREFGGRSLVLLPNTEYLTLPQFLNPRRRNRRAPLVNGNHDYQLIMNHDYDLLHWKVWYGFLGHLRSRQKMKTVRELAEACLAQTNGQQG
jgi:peptidoglycan/xylan/chitin deacetylase (PgdA/CDA1 family)